MRRLLRKPREHAVASAVALLFVGLVGTMAVVAAQSATGAARTARVDDQARAAQAAAESGLAFARSALANVTVGTSTDAAVVLGLVRTALAAKLDGTANMDGTTVELVGSTVYVPGRASGTQKWTALGDSSAGAFQLQLRYESNAVVVRSIGRSGGSVTLPALTRAVEGAFRSSRSQWVGVGAGVLSKSPVSMSNGAQLVNGDVTVTSPRAVASLDMSGGAKLTGNAYYGPLSRAPVLSNGATITGTRARLAQDPAFPEVDGSVFASFVPGAGAPQGPKVITASSTIAATATLTNIRIKANANTSFGNSMTLNGVIWIETPNRVTFGGGGVVNGVVVFDGGGTPGGNAGQNQLTVANGIVMNGVETLNAANFPTAERIAELKNLRGALVLAPNAKLVLAGGTRSYNGALVASEFDISNGYRGTITGSVVNLADTAFKMMGGGQIHFAGGATAVAGLYGRSGLRYDPASYREVVP